MTEPSTDEREALLAEQVRAIVHHSHGEDHTVESLVSWMLTGPLLAARPAVDERRAPAGPRLRCFCGGEHLSGWCLSVHPAPTTPAVDVDGIARVLRGHYALTMTVYDAQGFERQFDQCSCGDGEGMNRRDFPVHQAVAVVAYLAGEGRG